MLHGSGWNGIESRDNVIPLRRERWPPTPFRRRTTTDMMDVQRRRRRIKRSQREKRIKTATHDGWMGVSVRLRVVDFFFVCCLYSAPMEIYLNVHSAPPHSRQMNDVRSFSLSLFILVLLHSQDTRPLLIAWCKQPPLLLLLVRSLNREGPPRYNILKKKQKHTKFPRKI